MTDVVLFAPEAYRAMTDASKAAVCNGCGSKGLGGWIVPDTLWGLSITETCNIHDYMYEVGTTIKDKNSADRAFLNNMLRVIDACTKWGIVKTLRKNRAYIYYSVVKKFGGPAFWASNNDMRSATLVTSV